MNVGKRSGFILILLLLLMQMIPVSAVLSVEAQGSEEEYFIFKMNHGNDWSRLPTDAEINEALSALPSSEDKSDEYQTLFISYSYGTPQKVHALHLKDQEKYRFYANQVIITVLRTYESQNKLLQNSAPYSSQTEYYLGLKEVSEGNYAFVEIGVPQKGPDGELSPVQRPVDYDGSAIYGSGWIDGEPDAGASMAEPAREEPYPSTPEDDEDIPVEIVVGGAAAVAVVAAAMAKAKKAKKKKAGNPKTQKASKPARQTSPEKSQKQDETKEEEKPAGYILQLTQDNITLSEGKEAIVGIRVMKVDDKGKTTVATNAEIRLEPQKETRLILTPNVGKGVLNVKISQNGAAQQNAVETVRITAMLPDKTMETALAVTLETGWRMVFR